MEAAENAEQALSRLIGAIDGHSPMSPSLFLAAQRLGIDLDAGSLLDVWESRSPGGLMSSARYRWELTHERAPGALYAPEREHWVPWRGRDTKVMAQEGADFELRLTLPISIADGCETLCRTATAGENGARGAALLEEAAAVFRKDLASYVHAAHSWKDTFALYCLARRTSALDAMRPFAIAIAACYVPEARRNGHVVGRRFPFHDRPLVSATSMLATGLLALGQDVHLVARFASFVAGEARDGAWGDDGEPADVLTTMLAAELLSQVDPSFDVRETTEFLTRCQQPDGTFRALGPEVPWLTDAVATWLRDASGCFAARFRFPHIPDANRDHKTGLPYYAYFADLTRLFEAIPGLADAPCQLAFMDLAGFRDFNNAYGQDLGDAVLAAISDELAAVPESVAIRDGGDEFLLVGAPTGTHLPDAITRFRERWPGQFVERFGADAPPVVARVLVAEVAGRDLRSARERLGREVGALKHEETRLGRVGLFRDLGRL